MMKIIKVCLLLVCAIPLAFADDYDVKLLEAGKRIYEQGVLSNGRLLVGKRQDQFVVEGHNAACIHCHRRSGMGLSEGGNFIPPVTATALFGKLKLNTYGRLPASASGMTFKNWPSLTRPEYDNQTLAHALRKGFSSSGYQFQYLMPRYELDEPDMQALLAYLHNLSTHDSSGIELNVAHFATVITPEQPAEKRTAFLDVLQGCMKEKFNAADPASFQWKLHVWELSGPTSSWQNQLKTLYENRPVFALISGLGQDEWGPVAGYCEAQGLPCLFPNVLQPASDQEQAYNFYFFRGSQLEADVMTKYLLDKPAQGAIKRIRLISRDDAIGERAAQSVRAQIAPHNLQFEHIALRELTTADMARALDGLTQVDALIMMLSSEDLALLSHYSDQPPKVAYLLMSGTLGGLEETQLAKSWRTKALMTYPYDPPVRWNRRMDFNLRPWLAAHNIPRKDERMQGNTLAACNLLYEGILRLRGQYLRDYLVETIENYPASMGNAPAAQAFPRFSLGPGQRFSSKGAHLVRFSGPDMRQLLPEQEWIIP